MFEIQILTVLGLFSSAILGWFLCFMIVHYYRNRNNGNLSLLEKASLDLLYFYWSFITLLFPFEYFVVYPLPFNMQMSVLFFLIINVLVVAVMLNVIAIFCIKYIVIFHPSYFADSEYTDQELLLQKRMIVLMIQLIIFIIDYGFLGEGETTPMVKLLNGQNTERSYIKFMIVKLLGVISIVFVILIKVKIYFSRFNDDITIHKKMVLITIGLFCFACLIPLVHINSYSLEIIRVLRCLSASIICTLIPAFIILSNDHLKNHVKCFLLLK